LRYGLLRKQKLHETMRSLLTLPLLSLLWAAGAAASTITVGTFAELSDRITACNSTLDLTIGNDIIVREALILGQSCALTLSVRDSVDGKVALDGNGKTSIILVYDGASLDARNLRFINGYSQTAGGAVHIAGGRPGFAWRSGKGLFKDCEFSNNQAQTSGGAVHIAGHAVFDGCTFTGNSAVSTDVDSRGGAVYIGGGSARADFIDTTFAKNVAVDGNDVYNEAATFNYDCTQAYIGYHHDMDGVLGLLAHCSGVKDYPDFTNAPRIVRGTLVGLTSACESAPTACMCRPVKGKYVTDTDTCTSAWCARAATEYYSATGVFTDNSCETTACALGQYVGDDLVSCSECTANEDYAKSKFVAVCTVS